MAARLVGDVDIVVRSAEQLGEIHAASQGVIVTAGAAPTGRHRPSGRLRWIAVLFIVGSVLFGLGALPFYSQVVGLRVCALTFFVGSLFFTGAALMVVFSTVTSLVQLIAPNETRGRVMSIYMLAFRGGMPLGSLVSGYFATLVGAPLVIAVNGALLIAVAAYFLARSHGVREI